MGMEYSLMVTKKEKNPKWRGPRDIDPYRHHEYNPETDNEFLTHHVALEATLTEEEFKAVKKAVIEVIK